MIELQQNYASTEWLRTVFYKLVNEIPRYYGNGFSGPTQQINRAYVDFHSSMRDMTSCVKLQSVPLPLKSAVIQTVTAWIKAWLLTKRALNYKLYELLLLRVALGSCVMTYTWVNY